MAGEGEHPLQQAVDLVWTYLSFSAYRSFGSLVGPLDREEDQRRYITEDDVQIKTPDGATLSALLIRPKSATKPLPTLLEFTIYEAPHFAREAASHGYVAMVAYGRGAGGSTGASRLSRTMAPMRAPSSTGSRNSRGVTGASACMEWPIAGSPHGQP